MSAAEAGSLAGKTVVVTGASRGIGRAIAVRLARAGASVVGCSLRGDGEGFLAELDEAARTRSVLLPCDVRRAADVKAFAAAALERFGPPAVLVNNAGTVARVAFADMDEATWDDVVASNLKSVYLVTRAFLPAMEKAGGGRIVNVSSIAGRQGTPMLTAYCAAKHGVVGVTRALAEELRGRDHEQLADRPRFAVNAICPGSVDTDMLRIGMPGGTPNMSPADVAEVAFFLAARAPMALTGSCVDVFG